MNIASQWPSSFGSCQINVVEVGAEFECPLTGETHIVTDENAVVEGSKIHVTEKHWAALKACSKKEAKR